MKRVVVTGMGIISSIGLGTNNVVDSLQKNKSGIVFNQEYQKLGFRSCVSGELPQVDYKKIIERKMARFMADAAIYGVIAMNEAINEAELADSQISNPRTGIIVGSGGASNKNVIEAGDILRKSGIKKVGPYRVPRAMGSTTSACLATYFKIKGINYSISSACSTSAHCIGNAMEQIQLNNADVMFAGGSEELHWSLTMLFDAMGALSSKYNDKPQQASRAFDKDRDGFVISGGGGIIVLESLEHALQRGAKIIAEIVGYGATSDGVDMVVPSGDGAQNCMQLALQKNNIDAVDYINAHGTSTPIGDIKELDAIRNVFGSNIPQISSTKSLTGHALGAAGVNEAIYSLLMLKNNFLVKSVNISNLDENAKNMPIITQNVNQPVQTVMTNSFGFGGTNASLVFSKYNQ